MNDQSQSRQEILNRRMKQVFILFAIIGGFFLVAEHRAHLFPYLPWLFLAACPLMHLFMHHGHEGNRHDSGGDEPGPHRSTSGSADRDPSGRGSTEITSAHDHGEGS